MCWWMNEQMCLCRIYICVDFLPFKSLFVYVFCFGLVASKYHILSILYFRHDDLWVLLLFAMSISLHSYQNIFEIFNLYLTPIGVKFSQFQMRYISHKSDKAVRILKWTVQSKSRTVCFYNNGFNIFHWCSSDTLRNELPYGLGSRTDTELRGRSVTATICCTYSSWKVGEIGNKRGRLYLLCSVFWWLQPRFI